ncbi:MAG: acetylxylan esterase [Planctomycetales bacterium]|nr:acetylxylan esterase [Planctomycetales bacterium]
MLRTLQVACVDKSLRSDNTTAAQAATIVSQNVNVIDTTVFVMESTMISFRSLSCLLLVVCIASQLFAREPKEFDKDVNYDEARLPHYDLPPLLLTAEGKEVTTPEEWKNVRRPQIVSLFSNLIYGRVPTPAYPIKTEYEVVKEDSSFMDGRATRKDVRIRFSNELGTCDMLILVFVPNDSPKPVPCFLKHSFNDTKSNDFDGSTTQPGKLKNGWPLGEFLDRGYGFVAVYQQDLVGHNEVSFLGKIHKLFYTQKGQSFPKAHEWGVLATVAWGGSRALDYLETDADIDASRVAVMGHSKMGKAALWTAAKDERFAMAISAQSGCAGAALWRRKSGETLKKMVTRFPYWLCRNAWKFVEQEDDLPVDQHMLLALMAPRPVYVHSGVEDTWADGRGEYLSAYHASEVYRLLGKRGLDTEQSPPVGKAILDREVGYHIREGGHSIEMFDWLRFLDFADNHLKK